MLAAHIARSPPGHDPASFAEFLTKQWVRYRRMIDAGLVLWSGTFLEGELVGDTGISRTVGFGDTERVRDLTRRPPAE